MCIQLKNQSKETRGGLSKSKLVKNGVEVRKIYTRYQIWISDPNIPTFIMFIISVYVAHNVQQTCTARQAKMSLALSPIKPLIHRKIPVT